MVLVFLAWRLLPPATMLAFFEVGAPTSLPLPAPRRHLAGPSHTGRGMFPTAAAATRVLLSLVLAGVSQGGLVQLARSCAFVGLAGSRGEFLSEERHAFVGRGMCRMPTTHVHSLSPFPCVFRY